MSRLVDKVRAFILQQSALAEHEHESLVILMASISPGGDVEEPLQLYNGPNANCLAMHDELSIALNDIYERVREDIDLSRGNPAQGQGLPPDDTFLAPLPTAPGVAPLAQLINDTVLAESVQTEHTPALSEEELSYRRHYASNP